MKTFATAALAAPLALGIALVGGAASAHTGDLHASATCNMSTGEYEVTYTLTTANTAKTGSTMWRVGSSRFERTPSSGAGMDHGPVTSVGAQTIVLGTETLPGDTVGAGPWVYAYTTWSGYAKGSDGRIEGLKGDCAAPAAAGDIEVVVPTPDDAVTEITVPDAQTPALPGGLVTMTVALPGDIELEIDVPLSELPLEPTSSVTLAVPLPDAVLTLVDESVISSVVAREPESVVYAEVAIPADVVVAYQDGASVTPRLFPAAVAPVADDADVVLAPEQVSPGIAGDVPAPGAIPTAVAPAPAAAAVGADPVRGGYTG